MTNGLNDSDLFVRHVDDGRKDLDGWTDRQKMLYHTTSRKRAN